MVAALVVTISLPCKGLRPLLPFGAHVPVCGEFCGEFCGEYGGVGNSLVTREYSWTTHEALHTQWNREVTPDLRSIWFALCALPMNSHADAWLILCVLAPPLVWANSSHNRFCFLLRKLMRIRPFTTTSKAHLFMLIWKEFNYVSST